MNLQVRYTTNDKYKHLFRVVRKYLLSLSLLFIPLFGYFFWHTFTAPDTLSDVRDFSPTLGTKVIENLSTLPTLPIQEEADHFKIEDSLPDGIQIQYANQGENTLQTDTPKQTVSFPKDPKKPIEVRLDQERVIPIQDQSTEDYTVDTLIADQSRLEAELPSQKKWWEKILGSSASKQEEKRYLRYTSSDGKKTLLYAYEKDQVTGEKKLKHWTLYASGTGLEEEKYQLDNVKLKINENGDAEVFYFGEQQIQNEAVKAEVAPSLLERAQKTLEKDLGNDIFNNQTPDFIIPRPYYLNSQGEKRDIDWKWDEEKKTLSVSFSPESYPVALDPTLSFTVPGQSNTGSVVTGESSSYFGYSLTAGDFNADGKTDLAVGAYGYSSSTGRAYIFTSEAAVTAQLPATTYLKGTGKLKGSFKIK